MSASPRISPGPLSRRGFLQAGFLALGGLGLSDVLRLRAAASEASNDDTAIILIWLQGGPSHMETYDLKPEAPLDYRGEMNPIRTNVPGIDICELLPLHAKVADKFSVIRSISHGFANHAGGAGRFLSGRDPLRPLDPISQFPTIPTIVNRVKEAKNVGVPNYVGSANRVYGGGSSYLGESALPFVVAGDPNADNFSVPNLSMSDSLKNRLDDRVTLLKSFDEMQRDIDRNGSLASMDKFNDKAISILTSDRARQAVQTPGERSKTHARSTVFTSGASERSRDVFRRSRRHVRHDADAEPAGAGSHWQLGHPRRQRPHSSMTHGSPSADLRPRDCGPDRRRLPARPGQEGHDRRQRRIRSHAADQPAEGHTLRRHSARSRPLARRHVGPRFQAFANGRGHWLNDCQRAYAKDDDSIHDDLLRQRCTGTRGHRPPRHGFRLLDHGRPMLICHTAVVRNCGKFDLRPVSPASFRLPRSPESERSSPAAQRTQQVCSGTLKRELTRQPTCSAIAPYDPGDEVAADRCHFRS